MVCPVHHAAAPPGAASQHPASTHVDACGRIGGDAQTLPTVPQHHKRLHVVPTCRPAPVHATFHLDTLDAIPIRGTHFRQPQSFQASPTDASLNPTRGIARLSG